jgi:surface polysaccharide O-acyltransferase-like enzyme
MVKCSIEKPAILRLGLTGDWDFLGLACVACGVTLLVVASKNIPQYRWLAYIGRHSIVFYFFAGVYPAFIGFVTNRFSVADSYGMVMIATILSLMLSALTAYLINRYLPFLLDLRKLKCKKIN